MRTRFLKPGDLFLSRGETLFKTVLGSCVSLCLYDPQKGTAGMNHFVFPKSSGPEDGNHYGDIAMVNLIEGLMAHGSEPSRIKAALFGGAAGFSASTGLSPGDRNVSMALDILYEYPITLYRRDTGGCYGRSLWFDTSTGRIRVTKMDSCLMNCPKDHCERAVEASRG